MKRKAKELPLFVRNCAHAPMTLPERLRAWAMVTCVPGRAERLMQLAERYEAEDANGTCDNESANSFG